MHCHFYPHGSLGGVDPSLDGLVGALTLHVARRSLAIKTLTSHKNEWPKRVESVLSIEVVVRPILLTFSTAC